jgi:hypothetical protein
VLAELQERGLSPGKQRKDIYVINYWNFRKKAAALGIYEMKVYFYKTAIELKATHEILLLFTGIAPILSVLYKEQRCGGK